MPTVVLPRKQQYFFGAQERRLSRVAPWLALEVISRDRSLCCFERYVCSACWARVDRVFCSRLYVSWQKPTALQYSEPVRQTRYMFTTYIFEYLSRHALLISNASGKCAFDLNTQAKSKKCAGSCVAKLRMKSKSSEAQDS